MHRRCVLFPPRALDSPSLPPLTLLSQRKRALLQRLVLGGDAPSNPERGGFLPWVSLSALVGVFVARLVWGIRSGEGSEGAEGTGGPGSGRRIGRGGVSERGPVDRKGVKVLVELD